MKATVRILLLKSNDRKLNSLLVFLTRRRKPRTITCSGYKCGRVVHEILINAVVESEKKEK